MFAILLFSVLLQSQWILQHPIVITSREVMGVWSSWSTGKGPLVLKNASDRIGMIGWDWIWTGPLLDMYQYFMDLMWPFRDASPLDVSGHPILCSEQSWLLCLLPLCDVHLASEEKSIAERHNHQWSDRRAHWRIENKPPPHKPPLQIKERSTYGQNHHQLKRHHCHNKRT